VIEGVDVEVVVRLVMLTLYVLFLSMCSPGQAQVIYHALFGFELEVRRLLMGWSLIDARDCDITWRACCGHLRSFSSTTTTVAQYVRLRKICYARLTTG
jgi:hypothetical protein